MCSLPFSKFSQFVRLRARQSLNFLSLEKRRSFGEGMTISDDELEARLRLPEKTVATELGLCLTSLKKTCRQHGFSNWPYR